jgi:uncharacterized protein involved in exopolysaccharide biosynthesis
MAQATEDLSWLWQRKLVKRAVVGAFACVLLIFVVTSRWIIKPLYEAEVIVYVPLTILTQQLNQQGIGFASDREIDWYIQILKSNQLTDSLIKKYDLYSYFDINSVRLEAKNQLYRIMESRIVIDKTRYGSVSVKVRDNDAKRAADMANDMIGLGEVIKKNLLFPNRQESMRYVTSLYNQKAQDVAMLQKTLDSLINTGRPLQNDYFYNQVVTHYNMEFQELIARKGLYEREQKNFDTPLPSAYVISQAVPVTKPIWPRRGLLMAAGMALYLVIFIVIEIIRRDQAAST